MGRPKKEEGKKTHWIKIRVTEEMNDKIKELVERGNYGSVSNFFREYVDDKIYEQEHGDELSDEDWRLWYR